MDSATIVSMLKDILASPALTGVVLTFIAKAVAGLFAKQTAPSAGTSLNFWLHIAYLVLSALATVLSTYLSGGTISASSIQQALTVFMSMLSTHYVHGIATGSIVHKK